MTDIQIKYWSYVEDKRHNIVGENELIRHNVRTEGQTDVSLEIGNRQALASQTMAAAAWKQAEVAQQRVNVDKMVANSVVSLNEAKATGQNISNYIAGYGKEAKAQLSEVDAASNSLKLANSIKLDTFGVLINAMKPLSSIAGSAK